MAKAPAHAALDALGLQANLDPMRCELADGVVLTMRPPVADDHCAAKAAVAEVLGAQNAMARAAAHYGWNGQAQVAMADPAIWETRVERCLHVELAALVVTAIEREVDGETLSVPPSVAAFNQLFMMGDNLDRFVDKVRTTSRAVIAAKKD